MKANHSSASMSNRAKLDSRVKNTGDSDHRQPAHKLVAEIAFIVRKRTAIGEAFCRRQIALARLEASSVSQDALRIGPAANEC